MAAANTSPNVAKPSGLSPYRNGDGSNWNGAANIYYANSNDAAYMAIGDLVYINGTSDAQGIPGCTKAAGATTVSRGVVVGWLPTGPGGGVSLVGSALALENPRPAISTTRYLLVVDDPNVVFKAQLDNGTNPGSAALSTLLTMNASQNTPTYNNYQATTSVSAASIAVTAGLSLKLMGLVVGPENANVDVTAGNGQYAWVQCRINMHDLGVIGGQVGI